MKFFIVLLFASFTIISCKKSSPENTHQANTDKKIDSIQTKPSTKESSLVNRIDEIKKMYNLAKELELKNTTKCKDLGYLYYDSNLPDSKEFPHQQIVKKCDLGNGMEIWTGKFPAHEYMEDTQLFIKDGKVYFMFTNWNAEGMAEENRFYFDENEKIIQILARTNNNDPMQDLGPQQKIIENSQYWKDHSSILQDTKKRFKEAQ